MKYMHFCVLWIKHRYDCSEILGHNVFFYLDEVSYYAILFNREDK